jgi:toxin ParE1/3/4
MAFRVNYSEQAYDDLNSIIEYISNELHNAQAAERFFLEVYEKIKLLQEMPYLYPLCRDENLSARGCRFVAIGNYLMFYIADSGNSVVTIIRILYSRRNITAIFEE